MNCDKTFALLATLVLTVAGFQQLVIVPPAAASVLVSDLA